MIFAPEGRVLAVGYCFVFLRGLKKIESVASARSSRPMADPRMSNSSAVR